jgi:endo-1,4-beta-mannosidase
MQMPTLVLIVIPAAILIMLLVIIIRRVLGLKAAPSGMPDHLIGIRVVKGVGEFYSRKTNRKFVPRGNNYIRLVLATEDGKEELRHSTFDPGQYDHARSALALAQMAGYGYNVVRVFLNHATVTTPDGEISQPYLANLADFLELAAQHHVYVILTGDWLPRGKKYSDILETETSGNFESANLLRLSKAGVDAFEVFYKDLINGLRALNAHTEAIFSYELSNEHYFDNSGKPLSLQSGKVNTLNFKTYDMSSQADKDTMVEENLTYWIDSLRGTILYLDPTALVSVGFFRPYKPGPGDPDQRLCVTAPAIWSSTADFIDLHIYKLPQPGDPDKVMEPHINAFGMIGMKEKPIIMGEFGAERAFGLSLGAQNLAAWQAQSCDFGFDGWLLWTWDLTQEEDPGNKYLTALEGNGEVNAALAPAFRPDPCSPPSP